MPTSTNIMDPAARAGGAPEATEGGIRLNLGCGTNKIPGWINIDSVPAMTPDLLHDIARPLPFSDESVEEVLADGLLEHFDKYQRYLVFHEWTRVLKPGGRMNVGVPNFPKILHRYFKFRFEDFVDTIFGETMWESRTYLGHFGNHKWGYSRASLAAFVGRFGLEIVSEKTECLVLRVVAVKRRSVPLEELLSLEVYAGANAHGSGSPTMTLREIRDRIEAFYG